MPSCEQEPGQGASLCSGLIEEDKLTSSCHNMKWTLFNFPPLPLASSACFTPPPLEACRGMPPVSSPLADTEIAAILCARPGDYDSYLLSGCFPLSCLLAGKPSRGGDPGPRERCQVWASNLRCCLSRLNDSFETHFFFPHENVCDSSIYRARNLSGDLSANNCRCRRGFFKTVCRYHR